MNNLEINKLGAASQAKVEQLVRFWNQCSLAPFWVDTRLMAQYLNYPQSLVLTQGTPWRGVIWGRNDSAIPTLDAIFVLPNQRRQKIGSSLVKELLRHLKSDTPLRFGGGSHHFVPGLPAQFQDNGTFFNSLGFTSDWKAHDLLWRDSSGSRTTPFSSSTYRLIEPKHANKLSRLLTLFGKRWQSDTSLRLKALSHGSPEEIMGVFVENQLIGFCHIWSANSKLLGPSTFWLNRRSRLWGGIGPVGIHPNYRGLGHGLGVVTASVSYLKDHNIQEIGVDWTGIPGFYQACGFKPWLSYLGYHQA